MTKVLVLGSTGMLGSAVANHFLNLNGYETHVTHRRDLKLNKNSIFFNACEDSFNLLPKVDYIINCIGIIKPFIVQDAYKSIYLNSLFPRKLANYCSSNRTKLIHVSTDCVYSGKKGGYTEADVHDCLDFYGKSKSLGEPENCMVLRTSIIGEEIHKNASLVAWAISQGGLTVDGYSNHFWNGLTTKQYAKCCESIINNSLYINGLRHVHSPAVVSKRDMLRMISDAFNLNLNIVDYETMDPCDRSLASNFELSNILDIPVIEHQIKEMTNE